MKKFIYILLILPFAVVAQTTSENYVKTSVYKEQTQTSDASKTNTSVTYYDGLGRPIQTIAGKASNEGKDIITHIEYDGFGRQTKEYLPFAAGTDNLAYDGSAFTNTLAFYNTAEFQNTTNPYSEKFLEASPLGRVNKQAAPGDAWKGNALDNNDHTIKYAYLANNDNDAVKMLTAVAAWNSTTKIYDITFNTNSGAIYPAGTLYKTITQDENKAVNVYTGTSLPSKMYTVEEYKNQQGQLVLKRTHNFKANNNIYERLDTYYIYDQFGNLTYVSSPMANGSSSTTNRNNYTYQYKYDARNRVVEKKLPGKQWEYIVYDSQDRVVAAGPALSPFGSPGSTPEQGWMITRYDAFGRVAYTGWQSTGATAFTSAIRKTMQDATVPLAIKITSAVTIDGIQVNYTNVLPTGAKLLTVNYYDNYVFPGAVAPSGQIEGQDLLTNCKGLPTGSWVRALTTTSETFGETSYTIYDWKGRPVRTHTANYLGGYSQVNTNMDFDGTPQYTVTKHKRISSSAELITREDFTYTPQDRLLSHTHKINSLAPELMSKNEYTELGQLKNKKVGGPDVTAASYHQKVDYKYNIRGWLTDINNVDVPPNSTEADLFAFRIAYETGEIPLYNGNISETYWRSSSDNHLRKYLYNYDRLNRLTNAEYQKPGLAVVHSYDESITYDKNGNITFLSRNGGLEDSNLVVEIDALSYFYNGNQLMKVTDESNSPQGFRDSVTNTTDDFSYDANGNMKTDNNKGITAITYNHLNLPVEIAFGATNRIKYLYNAAGVKLKKSVTDGTNVIVVDYLSGFQYKGGVIEFFPTGEGYVDCMSLFGIPSVFNYIYQYKDHLGNVRVNYSLSKGQAKIKDESHYYPFGLKHMNYNMEEYEYQNEGGNVVLVPSIDPSTRLPNNYKYNGKELQDELGLNMYDYGARNYDPAIGRWMNIDPLAEKYFNVSGYVYTLNNPVYFIDPDGKRVLNGDEIRKQRKAEEVKQKEKIIADAELKYGTKKSDYTDKKTYNRYVKEKDKLKTLRKELDVLSQNSKMAAQRIKEFKEGSPEQFAIMDGIKNEYGEDVDVYVGVEKMTPGNWGATEANFAVSGNKVRPQSNDFGINTMSVMLAEKNQMAFADPESAPSTLSTTKHEMGHANYIILNTASYMEYLERLKERNVNANGGHNAGNPSGINAEKWQNQ